MIVLIELQLMDNAEDNSYTIKKRCRSWLVNNSEQTVAWRKVFLLTPSLCIKKKKLQ